MFAEIITIGDEILIGQIVDTNSAWMAQELNAIGVKIKQITSVSDTKEAISEALDVARQRADLILMTGGLGPTNDDITKNTLVEYFDDKLVMDESILVWVKEIFDRRGIKMPEVNNWQAMVPSKCTPLKNENGTAPGMWFEDKEKVFVSMPGVPYEMKGLMTNGVLPMVKKKFETPFIHHFTIKTYGIGESSLMEIVEEWEKSLAEKSISLAYLPSVGTVRLRLSSAGEEKAVLQNVNEKVEELKQLIPQYIYGYNDDSLEKVIGHILSDKNLTIATAESCTGGYIGHLLTSVPGSSSYYKGSVIAYSNEIKMKQLNVSSESLNKWGAVSEEVVVQMANGARENLDTNYAIATSGIAGPDGGSEEKPVGTVWIAIAGPNGTTAQKFTFGTNRERNIKRTANTSINILRKEILKNP